MHIVYITHEYPLAGKSHGGIGTYVKIMAQALTKLGVRVSVVGTGTSFASKTARDGAVEIYSTPQFNAIPIIGNFLNRWAVAFKIRKLHKSHSVAVVEAPEMGLAFMPKWAGITYLIRMNGGHHFFAAAEKRAVNKWRAFQEKQSFQRADHICAVSNYVAERTRELLNLGAATIPIIPNPADTAKFYKPDPKKRKTNQVLFVGSVCKKKGIEELTAAMPIVWKEIPEAELKIVGRDVLDSRYGGSFTAYLKNKIGEEPRITFIGPVPNSEVPKYIEAAAVCAYPSYMEALPLAWLEAMAMGKPFIGSNTGPGPEVVEHGYNGVLINPYDPKEIAEAILVLLKDTVYAAKLGENARNRVLEKYSAENLAKINLSYFEKIKKQ